MDMTPPQIRRRFPRELADHMIRAIDQGWRVEASRHGAMVYPADRQQGPIAVHCTPSDHRAGRNFVSRMRRAGYVP